MKQWLVIGAAVVFLALPVMVSAGEETVIPPEATWTPTPPTSGVVAESATRVVSTEPAQASDALRPVAVKAGRGPLALTEQDAAFQQVNRTVHDD
ncbi:MAG: hypothetical protein ACRERE_39765 [Candidatus Entotheonellia bacterium]